MCASCTSSGGGGASSSAAKSSGSSLGSAATTGPSSSASSSPSSSPAGTDTSSPAPSQPTLPANVPTTGPNTRAGEQPPVLPLQATKHTARGATYFAVFFVNTIDWGYATTSGTYVRHYAESSCNVCFKYANFLDGARKAGRHINGARITIEKARALGTPMFPRSERTIDVRYKIGGYKELTKAGKVVKSDATHRSRFWVSLAWRNKAWAVRYVAVKG